MHMHTNFQDSPLGERWVLGVKMVKNSVFGHFFLLHCIFQSEIKKNNAIFGFSMVMGIIFISQLLSASQFFFFFEGFS